MKALICLVVFLSVLITLFLTGTFAETSNGYNISDYSTDEQYPQVLEGNNNKTQIIHLNKGVATFQVEMGGVNYRAYITDNNGTLIMNLKNGFTKFDVSYTDAYILNIRSNNNWKVLYR